MTESRVEARMTEWSVEIRLENLTTGKLQTLAQGSEDTAMVMQLAQMEARFVHDGVKYWGGKPTVDPLNRKITYWCQGYPDS